MEQCKSLTGIFYFVFSYTDNAVIHVVILCHKNGKYIINVLYILGDVERYILGDVERYILGDTERCIFLHYASPKLSLIIDALLGPAVLSVLRFTL
jgi:hypothetical protein